jgi:hypothetical protein
MNAQEIVQSIGLGVAEAFSASAQFLGVEVDAHQNADIHPEYLTTVHVAHKLTAPDRLVSLETHMKELRKQARARALLSRSGQSGAAAAIDASLVPYEFGERDSQRIDILVRSSDLLEPPLLMVEAKLGMSNVPGIVQDVDRIVRLFDMYELLGQLGERAIYGAAVFHSMEEGNTTGRAGRRAQRLHADVKAHLDDILRTRSWLKGRVGLLNAGSTLSPVTGYVEHYDNGTSETVFAKESFHFAPGLILIGNADDVDTVAF